MSKSIWHGFHKHPQVSTSLHKCLQALIGIQRASSDFNRNSTNVVAIDLPDISQCDPCGLRVSKPWRRWLLLLLLLRAVTHHQQQRDTTEIDHKMKHTLLERSESNQQSVTLCRLELFGSVLKNFLSLLVSFSVENVSLDLETTMYAQIPWRAAKLLRANCSVKV